MSKRVVLVGHCGPDSSYLRMAVSSAGKDVKVTAADDERSLRRELEQGAALVLVNRVLDYGFETEQGVDVIRHFRGEFPAVPMMLISNYPEAQAAAVAAGAAPGFGKGEIGTRRVTEMLKQAIGSE